MVALTEPKFPQTLQQAIRHFDPDTAREYVRAIKWSDGPVCPKCGSIDVGTIKSRNRHQCRDCRAQFSLTTDTIFEGTHLGLDLWIVGVWMMVNCRNSVSSCEIARAIGCKQQSAWHLLHRVRHILAQAGGAMLAGSIESDSTLVGGLLANMPKHRRAKFTGRGPLQGKTRVHALRERSSGTVRASVVSMNESNEHTRAIVENNVATGSFIHTDSSTAYGWMRNDPRYFRSAVNHHAEEYVRGDSHVNGCESFFNYFRRALRGTYISATPEHLNAYVNEAAWRFNHRHLCDWDRFDAAMRLIVGKRLTYSELTGGAVR